VRAGDQRVVAETRIVGGVGHFQQPPGRADRVLAEGDPAFGLGVLEAGPRGVSLLTPASSPPRARWAS